jgi:cytochrome b
MPIDFLNVNLKNYNTMKTYIWSMPTRIFHWLLFIGMITAYLVSEEEALLNIHSSVGYMVGILIIFRIIWGFAGPKYSRFSDFPIGIASIKKFITDMKSSKTESPGHNPGASLVMLGIIFTSLAIVVSGTLLLASEGEGFFSFLQAGMSSDSLKEIHEIAVNLVIGLVIVHLTGNAVDFIFNRKTGTLGSMFTGYKNIDAEEVKLNSFQKIIATLGIVSALAILPYSLSYQKLTGGEGNKEKSEQAGNEEDGDD